MSSTESENFDDSSLDILNNDIIAIVFDSISNTTLHSNIYLGTHFLKVDREKLDSLFLVFPLTKEIPYHQILPHFMVIH